MKTKAYGLRLFGLFLLLGIFPAGRHLQAQIGNTFCNPVPVGTLPPTTTLTFPDNNFGSGSEPDLWPDCGGGNNSRFYFFRLPAGFTSVQIQLQPQESRIFQLALLDSLACPFPGPDRFVVGTDACGTPGATISIPSGEICLNRGGGYILKVSGQTGNYLLSFNAIPPSCTDGCLNGFETGIDSLAPPDILTSSLDSSLCAGDLVFLQVSDPGAYTSIVWNTGATGPLITVNSPGNYSASVSTLAGCSALAKIKLLFDADCVWPGDADLSRRVEARDILPIGLAAGRTGPPRSSGGIPALTFIGQPAPDWPLSFTGVYEGLNYKHADVDGNGVINPLDVNGIELNYGLDVPSDLLEGGRWAEFERASSSDPPLYIVFDQDSVEAGDTLRGTVLSGTALEPVSNLYGYGLNLELPMAFLDSTYFDIDFSTSWLDDDGDVSSFHQFVPTQGFADIGYTRTDQTGRSGSGPLFNFGVIVVDNLDGARVTKTRQLPFHFQDLLALDVGADSVLLNPLSDTVVAFSFCDSRGLSSATEFIQSFKVNSKTVNSGNNGGYRFLTVNANFLKANNGYTFGFRPGFVGPAVNEHWRAWLDINADGDFDDPAELLVDRVSSVFFQRAVFVPDTAVLGWTHLRVQMKRSDGFGPEACEEFGFGEVEDYFVEIRAAGPRYGEREQPLIIWPNPARDRVAVAPPVEAGELIELRLATPEGRQLRIPLQDSGPSLQLDLGGLPRGLYTVQLLGETGVWSGKLVLIP